MVPRPATRGPFLPGPEAWDTTSTMKRLAALLSILVLVLGVAAAAPSSRTKTKKAPPRITAAGYALGAFLGQPTGLTFRMGLSSTDSLEAKAAWNLGSSNQALALQASWLREFPGVLVIEGEDITPYLGGGLALDLGSSSGGLGLGIRAPLGLVYRFRGFPLELALEIGLGLNLLPSTGFASSGGLALRYRF